MVDMPAVHRVGGTRRTKKWGPSLSSSPAHYLLVNSARYGLTSLTPLLRQA